MDCHSVSRSLTNLANNIIMILDSLGDRKPSKKIFSKTNAKTNRKKTSGNKLKDKYQFLHENKHLFINLSYKLTN